ncbi:cupin domain-containing protein [Desulfoluna sp.]|uniref:cupin domain-containing protein n=1 Tax=Desulfoluna sp. TaxID=2045199 RepID=UPI00262BAE9D|nr:cupin domain-containing protein [Desulfoluna sp.]
MDINEKVLEELIRKVVSEQLGGANTPAFEKVVDKKSGVLCVKTSTVKPAPFDTGKAGDQVLLSDIVTLDESPRLGCGVMEMKTTSFDWTLKYDEVDYIIDGTLEIVIDGRKIVGNKGDIIFIPKDTSIAFSVPEYARFMYVTYPANWEEQ